MSKIEWTEQTWNPLAGCSVISPGCKRCYAMKMARRIELMGMAPHYAGLTMPSKAGPVWTGKVVKAPRETLLAPLKRKKPTTYFVNSMSDLFHEDVPDEWIDEIFAVMALCQQHTFQVLTKRSKRMREYLTQAAQPNYLSHAIHAMGREWRAVWPLPNVWLGVSCEDQTRADERILDLLRAPAEMRFISAEPLLGPIDLTRVFAIKHNAPIDVLRPPSSCPQHAAGYCLGNCEWRHKSRLDWVIVGGESGPRAREMKLDWARSIITQCRQAGVACFMKQLGSGTGFNLHDRKGGDPAEWPADLRVREMPEPHGKRHRAAR